MEFNAPHKTILKQRIIVLGGPAAGKTTIIRLLEAGNIGHENAITFGIDITKLKFETRNAYVDALVWEFGGQEIYNGLYAAFATRENLHLLVLDMSRNSEQEAEIWLEEIQAVTGGAPCIVILNKTDLSPYDLNRRDLLSRFPFILHFVPLNLVNLSGVEELKLLIAEIMLRYLPKLQVEDQIAGLTNLLENDNRAYFSYSDFEEMCGKEGIKNSEVKDKDIALFLHQSGLFYLYKPNDLPNALIINVYWLIGIFSDMLTDNSMRTSQGVIDKDEIMYVSVLHGYSPEEVSVVLDIMSESGITFETGEHKIILPGLMSRQIPPYANDLINQLQHLKIYFTYRYLPRQFFNLLLSKLQRLGFDEIWAEGILINNPLGTAVVSLSPFKKRIDLFVLGNERQNRRLLQKIRSMIHDVNESFKYTDYNESISVPDYPTIDLAYDELMLLNERKTSFITKFVNKKPVDINIQELLKNIIVEDKNKSINVFISYAHADNQFKKELDAHLSPLVYENQITLIGNDLTISEDVGDSINNVLEDADVILILLSPDYLSSRFAFEAEMPKMLQLYETGRVKLVPVLLRDTYWESLPINKLQVLPFDGQAIANSKNRDSVWRSVISEISRLTAEITGQIKEVETLRISKIRLSNIRCFDEVEIDLFNENGLQMVSLFLGENGVGKSTIMRSIPIGIASEAEAMALLAKMSGELLKTGRESGSISITLYSVSEEKDYRVDTHLQKGLNGQISISKSFPEDLDMKKLFLCAYGAARNRFGTDNAEAYSITNTCATLFNYDASLQNPELSFRRIQSKGISIDSLLRRVDQLLMLEAGSASMDNTGLKLKGPWGEFVPIGGLGDGYKAMLGWIADLLGWSLMFDETMFQSHISGIVVIDELEQHLHPRWQLIIIKLLKEIFPKIQFIISSHTPLLASGSADYVDSGIYTIERDEEHHINVKEIPRSQVEGKNFNDILLGAFGMLTSLSPKAIQNIEKFAYLSSQSALNENDTIEYQRISDSLIKGGTDSSASAEEEEKLKGRLSNFL